MAIVNPFQKTAQNEGIVQEPVQEKVEATMPQPQPQSEVKEEKEKKKRVAVPLTEEQKVFILKNVQNMTASEIAQQLGIQPIKVSNFVRKTITDLQKIIESPESTPEMKERAERQLQYLQNRKKGAAVPKKKSVQEKAAEIDSIFQKLGI